MNLKYYFMPGFTKEVSLDDDNEAIKKYLEFLGKGEMHESCHIGKKVEVDCTNGARLSLYLLKKCFGGWRWKRELLCHIDLSEGYLWEFPKILEEDEDGESCFGVMKTKTKNEDFGVWIFTYNKKYGTRARVYQERVSGRW